MILVHEVRIVRNMCVVFVEHDGDKLRCSVRYDPINFDQRAFRVRAELVIADLLGKCDDLSCRKEIKSVVIPKMLNAIRPTLIEKKEQIMESKFWPIVWDVCRVKPFKAFCLAFVLLSIGFGLGALAANLAAKAAGV